MATAVHYHICHYNLICQDCGFKHFENNEFSRKKYLNARICGSQDLLKCNHVYRGIFILKT